MLSCECLAAPSLLLRSIRQPGLLRVASCHKLSASKASSQEHDESQT